MKYNAWNVVILSEKKLCSLGALPMFPRLILNRGNKEIASKPLGHCLGAHPMFPTLILHGGNKEIASKPLGIAPVEIGSPCPSKRSIQACVPVENYFRKTCQIALIKSVSANYLCKWTGVSCSLLI